jgi:tetratricopeptide (TPR) repeat protein
MEMGEPSRPIWRVVSRRSAPAYLRLEREEPGPVSPERPRSPLNVESMAGQLADYVEIGVVGRPATIEGIRRLVVEPGWRLLDRPPDASSPPGPVTLRRRVTTEDSALVERVAIQLDPRATESQLTDGFQRAFPPAQLRHPFRWVSVAQERGEQRRYAEAIAELQRSIARSPRRAPPRQYLAVLLTQAGLRRAAAAQAQRAAELDPDATVSYRTWAQALRRDAVGRATWSEPDAPMAADALARGLARTPGNPALLRPLARELFIGPHGQPLRGAVLEPVLGRARREPELRHSKEYLEALVRAGAYAELEQEARAAGPDGHGYLALAVASQRGVEAAVQELGKLDLSPPDRNLALLSAALLIRDETRDYPTLVRLVERTVELGGSVPRAVQLQARALIRHEQALTGPGPTDAVKRYMVAMRTPEAFAAARGGLYHPCRTVGPPSLQADQRRDPLFVNLYQAQSINPDASADQLIARQTFTQQGDDTGGYRVSVRHQAPAEPDDRLPVPALTFYVARDQDQFRVISLGTSTAGMACQADRLLRAGKLPEARRWLDWAHDDFSRGTRVASPDVRAFLAAWRRGEPEGRAKMRDAIALLSPERDPKEAIARLTPLAARSGSEDILAALVGAHLFAGDEARALRALRSQVARFPHSSGASRLLIAHLVDHGQADEGRRVLAQALADPAQASDPGLGRLAADVAYLTQRPADADALVRELAERHPTDAAILNLAAWHGVVRDQIDDRVRGWARQAAELGRRRAILNTLAVVEALSGNLREAIDAMNEGMGRDELNAGDWLVLGAIAERLELWQEAAGHYRRIARPVTKNDKTPRADGIWSIAQARLAAVEAKVATIAPVPL